LYGARSFFSSYCNSFHYLSLNIKSKLEISQ
jgi:hypothetical protein